MNLHEYQAKKLLDEYGIPIPSGKPAFSVNEALHNANDLGGDSWVVKVQVHSGGRGKAGGIKIVKGKDELKSTVDSLLGSQLITKQSAPHGQPVSCVLIQRLVNIKSELYLSLSVDRVTCKIAIVTSAQGGMDIEKLAIEHPEKITTTTINPLIGLNIETCQKAALSLGLESSQQQKIISILECLYKLYIDKDINLIEINPLVVTEEGELLALDAKIIIDDNALFRQPELKQLHDLSQENEKESFAKENGLSYIALEGNIACMVNGAGLAMATMDIIKLYGGEPANFLDVGGGATKEKVTEAFKLIVSDKSIKAILVNIFGGIVRCDLIAEGIIKAIKDTGVDIAIIVRLEGTNVAEGKLALIESGLTINTADDLDDAAKMAVAAAKMDQ